MLDRKFYPFGSRVCIIKIISYDDRNPRGILQNPNFEKDVYFDNLTQLLFSMDALYDSIGSPQRTMSIRGIVNEPAEYREDKDTQPSEKPIATFRVDVMFRQNASWQGQLVWLENKEETDFRSELELIMIMDGILRTVNRSASA